MALSLDSIHQPLNDFFLNHFKTDAGSNVLFRFDKFGSVISDQDFIDPSHPDLGYSANRATEQFSDLVNRLPIEDTDGLNIFLSQAKVDDAYFELLGPSLPFIPSGIDDQSRDSIVSFFSRIKNDAMKDWDNIKLESSTGLMFDFRPSFAGPKDWYNKTNADNWTHQTFQIGEPTTPPVDNAPQFLWRKKIDDATMQQIVPLTAAAQPVEPAHLATTLLMANPIRPMMATRAMVNPSFQPANIVMAPRMMAMRSAPMSMNVSRIAASSVARRGGSIAADSFVAQDAYLGQLGNLQIDQRIAVSQYLGNNAPTQPATTNSISINFDYCMVTVSRPWYRASFINNRSWFIPNTTKGQLTAQDTTGVNITVIPVGVVAIKNLDIKANWSASDIANSKDATEFGPFKVSSEIVNNTLSHPGIQLIGWLVERMPALPPNDPPA